MDAEALRKLNDPTTGFVEKLRLALQGKLVIWVRSDKPNITESEFRKVMRFLRADTLPNYRPRESDAGPHGLTGEDECFVIHVDVTALSRKETFYVKGFFFDKGNCIGVAIQSARRIKLQVQKPRI